MVPLEYTEFPSNLCHSVYEGGDVLVHGQSVPSLGFFYFSRETVVREGNISECHAVAVKTAVGIYDFLIISGADVNAEFFRRNC